MKTYINIEVLGRKIVLQKDILGSYQLGILKKNTLPMAGRIYLEEWDRKTSNEPKIKDYFLILSTFQRQNPQDIINNTHKEMWDSMRDLASSVPATDISEPMKPIVLTKEERQRIDEVLKKANQTIIDLKGNEHNVTKQMYGI
jgi:hypothetical protein